MFNNYLVKRQASRFRPPDDYNVKLSFKQKDIDYHYLFPKSRYNCLCVQLLTHLLKLEIEDFRVYAKEKIFATDNVPAKIKVRFANLLS